MKSVLELKARKESQKKITMVTCYDYWSAKLLAETSVDCLLVGDSVSMVFHGFDSTVHADIEMMVFHTKAVARAQTGKLIVADLPFLAHRKGKKQLMIAADRLMKAGAHILKLETQDGQEKIVQYLSESGIPVIGHLGLTPQHVNQLGGYKVQGRSEETAQKIKSHALALQSAGCHALVLECVPSSLATELSFDLDIPTIGIGAGSNVDGQVLVLHDLLGFNSDFKPRFVRRFAQGKDWMNDAIEKFTESVHSGSFPASEESFK